MPRTRHTPAAVLAIAALAAACASAQQQPQMPQAITRVATARELKQAVEVGAQHVELTAHLDLSQDADLQAAPGLQARLVTHFADPTFQTFRVRRQCLPPTPPPFASLR